MPDLTARLRNFTTIGKKVNFHHKNRKSEYYELGEVVDEVSQIPSYNPEYKMFIQKIRDSNGEISFRICYYSIDSKKQRLVFGQYASQLYEENFKELIRKAKEKGFF